MSLKQRYRPLWVILHWLMALLVFSTFGIGLLSLANHPNTDAKLVPLGVHMALGIAILLIVVFRYILRMLVFKPPRRSVPAASAITRKKPILLDRLAPAIHILLYFLTALMALLGIAIAIPADLFSTVWGTSGAAPAGRFLCVPGSRLAWGAFFAPDGRDRAARAGGGLPPVSAWRELSGAHVVYPEVAWIYIQKYRLNRRNR
jgi:cytochrome b561